MKSNNRTTDHRQIKNWVNARAGIPVRIKKTSPMHKEGFLHIYFPDSNEDSDGFQRITWQHFFDVFQSAQLAFLYENAMNSRFHRFVNRE